MSDLVSVVIPTRRRPDTLVKTIGTVLDQNYRNIEVIVSNNGQDPETDRVVQAIGDDRIRLIAPPSEVGMSQHFEFAMTHARGEWIAVIGDDDGVLPDGLERGLAALRDSGLEALGSRKIRYLWPNLSQSGSPPLMGIPRGRGWTTRNSRKALRDFLDRKVDTVEAPTTYTGGIFHRRLYEKIRDVRGNFYQSQNPDIYSSFAFCSVVDRYVLHRRPLFVAGTSRHSTGLATMRGETTKYSQMGNIAVHPMLNIEGMIDFTFSIQAILYEAFLQSSFLRDGDDSDILPDQLLATVQAMRAESQSGARMIDKHKATLDWVTAVARQNNVASYHSRSKAAKMSLNLRVARLKHQVVALVGDAMIDQSFGYQLDDVCKAVRVAQRFMDRRPSQLYSYFRTVARRLGR